MALLIKSVPSSGTFYNMGIPTFRLKNKYVNILAFHEKLNSAADVVIFRLLNIIIPMTPKHRTDFGLNHRGIHDQCLRICLFANKCYNISREFSFS